jgi:hypothetical protein
MLKDANWLRSIVILIFYQTGRSWIQILAWRLAILREVFHGFLQSFLADVRIIP